MQQLLLQALFLLVPFLATACSRSRPCFFAKENKNAIELEDSLFDAFLRLSPQSVGLSKTDRLYKNLNKLKEKSREATNSVQLLSSENDRGQHGYRSIADLGTEKFRRNAPGDDESKKMSIEVGRRHDKRYVSYLTLCHFKICNFGRKRNSRYFHMPNAAIDGN